MRDECYGDAAQALQEAIRQEPETPILHFLLGSALSYSGDARASVEAFTDGFRLQPDAVEWFAVYGDVLHATGRSAEAVPYYRRYLREVSASANTYGKLALALVEAGKADEAYAFAQRALDLEPDNPYLRMALAQAHGLAGRWEEALVQARQAFDADPQYTPIRATLASALLGLGQCDEALVVLQDAIRLDPDEWELYSRLGDALESAKRYPEAIATYREYLARHADNVDALLALGTALLLDGHGAEALAAFCTAVRIHPTEDDVPSFVDLADALRQKEMLDSAIILLREVVAKWPSHPLAYEYLGVYLNVAGQRQEGTDMLLKAFQVATTVTESHWDLAALIEDHGKWQAAVKCYREIARMAPENPWAHVRLGRALEQTQRDEAAERAYREAIRVVPHEWIPVGMHIDAVHARATAHCLLGRLLGRQEGREEEAIIHLREALRLDPTQAEAHYALGVSLNQRGCRAEARAEWETVLTLDDGEIADQARRMLAEFPSGDEGQC
jgi:tetratricopeptide (TPR) repeat protein